MKWIWYRPKLIDRSIASMVMKILELRSGNRKASLLVLDSSWYEYEAQLKENAMVHFEFTLVMFSLKKKMSLQIFNFLSLIPSQMFQTPSNHYLHCLPIFFLIPAESLFFPKTKSLLEINYCHFTCKILFKLNHNKLKHQSCKQKKRR